MAFDIQKTPIEDLFEIQPKVFGDNRGFFLETYSKRDFEAAGLNMNFVQDNMSSSTKGVLRGLHFQKRHPQGKLVSAVAGKVYDVAVDLRVGSATFGKYHGVLLDSDKHNAFYIAPGFAHGFYVLTDTAVFAYKCTDFYHPEDEGGIMWNDPTVNVNWNEFASGVTPVLSAKDEKHPLFDMQSLYFDLNASWIGN